MRDTLGEVLDDRGNSLTAVRLVLAMLVLGAHAASLSGLADHPLVGGVGLGTWAVMGFFAISGYLIPQSRTRQSLQSFLIRRAARIMPAFWMANILTAALAAPLVALLAGTHLALGEAVMYPIRNAGLTMRQWTIQGSLENAPYTDVWNGSLWTLAQEAGWYLFIGVVLVLATVRRNLVAASSLLLLMLTALNVVGVSWAVLGAFFAAGTLLFSLRDRVPVRSVFVVGAAVLLLLAGALHQVVIIAPLPLAYLVLSASALRIPGFRLSVDLSYGVYLFAFPVEQVLAQCDVQRFGLFLFATLTAAVTLVLARLSWTVVEAPAIRVGARFGRGPVQAVGALLPKEGQGPTLRDAQSGLSPSPPTSHRPHAGVGERALGTP